MRNLYGLCLPYHSCCWPPGPTAAPLLRPDGRTGAWRGPAGRRCPPLLGAFPRLTTPARMLAAQPPWGPAEDERLAEAGFVTLPGLITAEGLRVLNAAVDEHLAQGQAPDATAPWLFDCDVGDALWQLANEPAVLTLARQLCGPNVLLWAGGLAVKLPCGGDGGQSSLIPWHQDAPYWNIYPERHGVIWGALERVGPENGSMSVLPGYHRRGCIPRLKGSDPDRKGFHANIDPHELPSEDEISRLKVDYEFEAGTCAVHHIML
eukprot:COSAG05_NODE_7082_length_858_cov_0.722003_1_plen_262_part_01